MSSVIDAQVGPWYRQLWPWLLMLGPALVLVAGAYTTWLAYSTDDGLVARDYYKRGLLINRTLQRNHNAVTLGIRAQGTWNPGGTSLALRVIGTTKPLRDPVMRIVTGKSGSEMVVPLRPIGGDWYEAAIERPPSDRHWRGTLETEDWRLTMVQAAPGLPLEFVAADP